MRGSGGNRHIWYGDFNAKVREVVMAKRMNKFACWSAVLLFFGIFTNQALALGGFWNPASGKTYTATFTDGTGHEVVGHFTKKVSWDWVGRIFRRQSRADFEREGPRSGERPTLSRERQSLISTLKGIVDNGAMERGAHIHGGLCCLSLNRTAPESRASSLYCTASLVSPAHLQTDQRASCEINIGPPRV